jgi:hypothetical protein
MIVKRFKLLSVVIALLSLSHASAVFTQGIVTGSISGTVQDSTSAVITGATVTARQT